MATSEILGLFQTPDQYSAAQDAALQRQFIQRATLDPFQKASVLGQQAGYSAAQGIGGALGGTDPQLEMISRRNVLLSQLDPNDPKSYGRVAEAAARMGDSQFAVAIAQEGRKASSELALAQQRTAEKMTPEERNAAAYARSVAEPGTPQYNSIYQTTLQALISKEKPDLTTPDQKNAKVFALQAGPEGSPAYNEAYIAKLEQFTTKPESRPVIKEIGVAKGTEEAVYTYQQGNNPPQQVVYRTVDGQQQIVPYSGPVDRTTAKTNLGVKLPEGESEFVKELGKLDAKAVAKASEARGIAIDQLTTLKKMAEVADRPVISGSLAEQRTDVSNFFNTIGLSSSKDRITTANSQEYIKYSTGLVLDNLRKTGYNPSNADMKVVQSIIPRLETDPMARRELIQFMSERANDVITETTQLDTYARKNRGLSGYTPKIPQVNFNAAPASSGRFPELSDAQIAERIRVLKQQQGK
jgi:hypothetical protein